MSDVMNIVLPSCMGPGRAQHILAKALCYAVAAMDSLPEQKRTASDRDDIVALILANFSESQREIYMAEVERNTGHAPDMTDWKGAGL